MKTNNMYAGAKTWNPLVGCNFDCTYCKPSFKAQRKRQKQNCLKCYRFEVHEHPNQLKAIPATPIVFVAGGADISFARPAYVRQILDAIRAMEEKKLRRNDTKAQTYYLQSKRPECFEQFLSELPPSVALVTTLETNRDEGYPDISKAPVPSERYHQFKALKYPRKIVTIEPLMDFDAEVFANWVIGIGPERVWLGFNSRPKQVVLPEPSVEKLQGFARVLVAAGIDIHGKRLRGTRLDGVTRHQD